MKKSPVKNKPIKHLIVDKEKLFNKEKLQNSYNNDRLEDSSKNIIPPDQRNENIAKYGSKEDDTIARAYRKSKETGDVYCAFNAEKYITRFNSDSKKAKNSGDLRKAIDYLQRMIEKNEEKEEVIEK